MEAEKRVVAMAERQCGAVALRQAVLLGLSPRTMQHRVESAGWGRLLRGVYALPGTPPTYELRAMAAQLAVIEGALVAGRSAARVWGLTEARPTPVELFVPYSRGRTTRGGVLLRRSRTLIPNDQAHCGAINLTAPARTICDLAGQAGPEELLEVAATALQRRLVRVGDVRARMERIRRMPGAALLRDVLGELEHQGRTDSAFERGLRRGLHANGFRPHPGVYQLLVAGRLSPPRRRLPA